MATTTLNVHIHVYFVTTGLTNSWRQIKHAKGRSSSSLELTTYLLSSSASESTIHSLHPNIPSPRSRRLRFSSCSFCHSFSYKIESFGFHYNLPTTLVIASIMNEFARVTKRAITCLFVILTNFYMLTEEKTVTWLIIKTVWNCNMTRTSNWTLCSSKLVCRQLILGFHYVLMVSCSSSVNICILFVTRVNNELRVSLLWPLLPFVDEFGLSIEQSYH